MQITKLQFKKRVVYKQKNVTSSGAKNNRNETTVETIPTLTITGVAL